MLDIAFATVLVSAGLSIVTGFLGALLSTSWVRRQERRTYGLALLAEVKSIRRSLLRYAARLERADQSVETREAAISLRFWRQDLAVFANNTGRIGLFSSRTAIELIELYHQVRWLEARIGEIDAGTAYRTNLQSWIVDQKDAVRRTRARAGVLSRMLRRELPVGIVDTLRGLPRAARRNHGLKRGVAGNKDRDVRQPAEPATSSAALGSITPEEKRP